MNTGPDPYLLLIEVYFFNTLYWGRCGYDRMAAGFIATYAISAYDY
jgi:hypothetical protein